MSTIHFNQTTTLTPEQYIAGLTDFGPGSLEGLQQERRRQAIEARNNGAAAMTSATVRAES